MSGPAAFTQVMSCSRPGCTPETQIGNPPGSERTWMLPPWRLCFPLHREDGPPCAWRSGASPGECCATTPYWRGKYTALTTRQTDKLTTGQAHIACAAAVLRWIYALTVHHTTWDPRIASGVIPHDQAAAAAMTSPMAA